MRRFFALVIPAFLTGCGTLSQPFLGRPGPEGALLSVPPPPVLIVPSPRRALLGDEAARLFAADLAHALVKRDIPSLARPANKFEWRLITAAHVSGDSVIPTFAIIGPDGKAYGHTSGQPVAVQVWANGERAMLDTAAAAAAPGLARELAAINARVQQSNPLSLENRPSRVMLMGVSGAPGDGDHALALDLARNLGQLGVVVVRHKDDADFLISGKVKVSSAAHQSAAGSPEIVELDWVVRNQNGGFIGKVSQLHNLSPAQMVPYWGDVAVAAAQQASLGIKQVIVNAIPKHVARESRNRSSRPDAAILAKSLER